MSNKNYDSQSSYLPQLDGLRAFAVASVAFSHWVPLRYQFDLPWGSAGVQLFFVLSGFLITGILLRCKNSQDRKSTILAFYVRRFLRIFPVFYATLTVAYVMDLGSVRETIIWHASYLSNFYFFFRQDWQGEISHFWSLAVEEQFYLIWPAIILCVPDRYILRAVIILIAIGVLSQLLLPEIFPEAKLLMVLPNSNFDALGLGALIACVSTSRWWGSFTQVCKYGLPIFSALLIFRAIDFIIPVNDLLEHFSMLMWFVWLIYSAVIGFDGYTKMILISAESQSRIA